MSQIGAMLEQGWQSLVQYFELQNIPQADLVSVAVIVVVGIVGGRIISEVFQKLLKMTSLDELAVESDVQSLLRKLGYSGSFTDLVSDLIKYSIYALVIFTVFNYMGMSFVLQYMDILLQFVPRLLLALLVIIIGFRVSTHIEDVTVKLFRSGPMSDWLDDSEPSTPAYKIMGQLSKTVGYIATILVAMAVMGVRELVINLLIGIFSLGLVAVFIVSSKDILMNFAASIYFQASRSFASGENIEVGGYSGELIGITPLYTKLKDGETTYNIPNIELVRKPVEYEK
ncbi:MAG: mechanosensitive ion channel [Candidatus Nanohaloarchaeota archaeon QJJ-9]|nr:mechanosensitive ion channel [Candidatus Nanohaloarchaeota archaeon QJJ-9]